MRVHENVAIATGASSGTGLAAARLLARQGAKVALAARSARRLAEVALELPGSAAIVTDMTGKGLPWHARPRLSPYT